MESGMEWLQAVSVLQLEKKDKESDGGFVEVEEGHVCRCCNLKVED